MSPFQHESVIHAQIIQKKCNHVILPSFSNHLVKKPFPKFTIELSLHRISQDIYERL